jgi:hypothetical protein
VLNQVVSGLDASRVWFFAVTARDLSGNESGFSAVINRQPSITPTVRTVTPSESTQGDTGIAVTITGTNFVANSTVSFGAGITVTGVNTSGAPGTLVATIDVGSLAQAKAYNVSVTNPGGSTATRTGAFRVNVDVARLDIDGSQRIDGADLLDILLGFPSMTGDAYYSTTRDLDVDGLVDGADLSIFFSFFGVVAPFP